MQWSLYVSHGNKKQVYSPAHNFSFRTNLAPTTSKAHLMAGGVRHHRADIVGASETQRRINRVFEI